jgi:chemotaxis protein methyltransferase CheR
MIREIDRAFVAALCKAWAGLRVDADKGYLIESRISPLARREGYDSPAAFIEALRNGCDERLGWATVEAMVVGETEFFRNRAVFDRLVSEMLPALACARGGEPVRVWAAGCGTGQEIYSLAMLLAEAPTLAARTELFASDLSERSLERAQAGLYSHFDAQRGLPARSLVRYFERRGEGFVLSPRIRQMVRWRRVNLMSDLSQLGPFDLILCRNTLGQLEPDARSRVLGALRRALATGGRLVLGPDDRPGEELTPIAPEIGVFAAAEPAAVLTAA